MAANIHSGIDPGAQGLLSIAIVFELVGVDEAIRAVEMLSLQLRCQVGRDLGARLARRKTARGRQVVEGKRHHWMWIERRQGRR